MDYIIRHSERVRTTDWKVTGGKIIVKGELEVFLGVPASRGERTAIRSLPDPGQSDDGRGWSGRRMSLPCSA